MEDLSKEGIRGMIPVPTKVKKQQQDGKEAKVDASSASWNPLAGTQAFMTGALSSATVAHIAMPLIVSRSAALLPSTHAQAGTARSWRTASGTWTLRRPRAAS